MVHGEHRGTPVSVMGLLPQTAGTSHLEHSGFDLGDGNDAMEVEEEVEDNPITTDMFFKHIAHFYFMLLTQHFSLIRLLMKLLSH